MKTLINCFIWIFILLNLNSLFGQASNNNKPVILWNDSELYKMAMAYNLQDSFFELKYN
ncbi:MAG: hypothetical protein IPK35_04745 [Saprospiraceae bacterium]|nr:hypothetical protein [Saprospiraceae bacterium]